MRAEYVASSVLVFWYMREQHELAWPWDDTLYPRSWHPEAVRWHANWHAVYIRPLTPAPAELDAGVTP